MGPLSAHRDILESVPFFAVLDHQQRAALRPAMHCRSFPRRAFILRAGEKSDSVHIMLRGRANVVLDDGNGHEMIVCPLGPHDIFGELSMVDGQPRSASVLTVEPCEVIGFARSTFLDCLRHSAEASMLLVGVLAARLRATDARMVEVAFAEVSVRVARVLLASAQPSGSEWVVGEGTEQIARMVAASREMVSRILRRLQQRGIIRRQKRTIVVVDRDALGGYAQAQSA
jgi:CRP/FNR family transcriptional regulator, cyclic AMP receptor protein